MPEDNPAQTECVSAPPAQVEESNLPPVEVHVDLTKLEETVAKTVERVLKARELDRDEDEDGKGVVESDRQVEYLKEMTVIAEGLKEGEFKQRWLVDIREQWTKVLPKTTKEVSAHIRDYCFISYVLQGKQGDTVNCFAGCGAG